MALILVTSLYALILLWVSWRYLRHRDPLLRDVMWMFASVAMLFVLGLVRLFVGAPPRTVMILAIALLLAKPLFTLRLVGRLRPLRSWWWPVAVAGWAVSALPVLASATRPVPRAVIWPAVLVFFIVEGISAWRLGAEARRRGGAARARLWCAAVGTGVFGAALVVSATSRAVEARTLAVFSGLLYLVAFVPPRWLRRMWSLSATHAAMRRMLDMPANESARTWQSFCQDARAVLGADAVVVLMPAADQTVQVVGCSHRWPDPPECTVADVDALLDAGDTIEALAGGANPPAVAVLFAEATGTRYMTATPVQAAAGRGALLLLNQHRSLFAEEDIAAFTELAGHAAALAGRAQTLAERESLAAVVDSSHDAIIRKTPDGVITSWNTGAQQLYGYRRDEVIGRHASMLFPPGQEQAEAKLLERSAQGERIDQHRTTRRCKDGTTTTVSLTLSPITDADGQVVGVASLHLPGHQRTSAGRGDVRRTPRVGP